MIFIKAHEFRIFYILREFENLKKILTEQVSHKIMIRHFRM